MQLADLLKSLGDKNLGRFPGTLWAFEVVFGYLAPKKVMTTIYDGLVLDFYPRATPNMLISKGEKFIPPQVEYLKSIVSPGMTVVVIGAGIGYNTLVAARQVGPFGKVFAFEAFPKTFEILRRNVDRAGYPNIILEEKAVSDSIGIAKLFLSRNPFMNSLGRGRTKDSFIEVPTITLDSYMGRRPIDIIKMNIEGSEPLVLRGMREVIDNSPKLTMVTEADPIALRGLGVELEDYLEDLLKSFSLKVIDMRRRTVVPFNSKKQVMRSLSYNRGATYLICTRR